MSKKLLKWIKSNCREYNFVNKAEMLRESQLPEHPVSAITTFIQFQLARINSPNTDIYTVLS